MGFDFQAAYSELNADDADYRFYAALADDVGARRVLDLGCGTGTLARLLAAKGRSVVGIDPDPAMLAYAANAPGGDLVDWRLGHSDIAPTDAVDFAIMCGHVAQVFRSDDAWAAVLGDMHRALASSGTLAFESRNPDARKWEGWTRDETLRVIETPEGPVEFWHETASVRLPLVAYDTFTRNLRSGEQTRDRDVLAFRTADELVDSVRAAGFSVSRVLGDWDGARVCSAQPEVIVVATKT